MKYILISVMIGFMFIGCSKKSDVKQLDAKTMYAVDSTDIKTTPASNPNETFNLNYNFEKGKHYQYRLSAVSHDEQITKLDTTITQTIDQSVIYIMDVNLANVEKDGAKEMNCEITSVKLDADVNGKMFRYESGTTKDTADIERFAEYYSLINNPFSIRIGANGGILDIFKTDKIIDKYIEARKIKTALTPAQKDQLKNGITENLLKRVVGQIFREMTAKTIAKDSTWNIQQPTAQYLVFKLDNTDLYKIAGLEMFNNDKLAVIDAGLKTVITGDTHLKEQGADYNFKKPETSTSGKIYFNLTKGCIQKSKVKTNVQMSFTMEGPTPKGKQKGSKSETITSSNIVELL